MRGFFYHHYPGLGKPRYAFCSMLCLDAGSLLAYRGGGVMPSLTDFEINAFKDARHGLAAALSEAGVLAALDSLNGEQVDKIIMAVVVSFQASMARQALVDDIPF